MAAKTDESLMEAYQRGEVAAFEELVTRHERPLWAFMQRFVGDAATAEDLLQEVFLRVVRASSEWKSNAKFSTWLYTIARNLCTDHSRRAGHRRALSLDTAVGVGGGQRGQTENEGSGPVLLDRVAAGATVMDGVGSAGQGGGRGGAPGSAAGQGEAAAMNRQLAARIDRAVAALPEDQREVFLMREVMDMAFADIALAVGASEPTVKSRMRYALEKLRDSLAAFREDDLAGEDCGGAGADRNAATKGPGRAGKLT